MPVTVRVLLCTCPEDKAESLADGLLRRRLAACVNIVGGVRSRYWWKGKIERDDEALLVIKTESARVPALVSALGELHPYDVPELLSLPVESGAQAYLDWVSAETRDPPPEAP